MKTIKCFPALPATKRHFCMAVLSILFYITPPPYGRVASRK